MAKRAKKTAHRKARKRQKSGSGGAATMILLCAVGVGLLVGVAGFESGAIARDAYDAQSASLN